MASSSENHNYSLKSFLTAILDYIAKAPKIA